jgi:hypothetical protein
MRPAATVPNRQSPHAAPIALGASLPFPGPLAPDNLDHRIVGWLLSLATAGARMLFTASLPARKATRSPADTSSVRQLLTSSGDPSAMSWHQLGMLPSGAKC